MLTRVAYQTRCVHRRGRLAFTLTEVLVSLVILVMVIAGVTYGYQQVNRISVWDSMNQAAQAFAIRGMESARAAKWNPWAGATNTTPDPGGQDELPNTTNTPSLIQTNVLDIPISGTPGINNTNYYATNYIFITQYPGQPPIREIRSECVWSFSPFHNVNHGQLYTNTIITLRGPDQ
jgi:type II secretory pathway pseudopilin PulG